MPYHQNAFRSWLADQGQEISVACLMTWLYITFPCVNFQTSYLYAGWVPYWYFIHFQVTYGMAPGLQVGEPQCAGTAFGDFHAEKVTHMYITQLKKYKYFNMKMGVTTEIVPA
jgi:hypothetical protein